jgi:hypothetical protein
MTEHYRAFGGPADGRWFPDAQSVILSAVGTPPLSSMDADPLALVDMVERYRLQTWVYHDTRRCMSDWRMVALHRGCLWRGRAWVREDDPATEQRITDSLNVIVGLCQMGMA